MIPLRGKAVLTSTPFFFLEHRKHWGFSQVYLGLEILKITHAFSHSFDLARAVDLVLSTEDRLVWKTGASSLYSLLEFILKYIKCFHLWEIKQYSNISLIYDLTLIIWKHSSLQYFLAAKSNVSKLWKCITNRKAPRAIKLTKNHFNIFLTDIGQLVSNQVSQRTIWKGRNIAKWL